MFWRVLDRDHPMHRGELLAEHGQFLPELYAEMDRAIGKAMRRLGDDDLLIVMSDHGFTTFRRATETPFNLILEARP